MNSDNINPNLIAPTSARQDPGFEVIVDFDWCDGPRSGIAVYPNGHGVRFSVEGESRGDAFRVFILEELSGNWWPDIKSVADLDVIHPECIITGLKDNSNSITN